MLTKFTVAIIMQFKYVSIITAFSDSEAGEIPARKRMSDLIVLLGCCFFSAALGLHYYMQAFSTCREWGPLSSCSAWAFHCGGSSCGAWALGEWPSVAAAHELSNCGAWA